MSNPTTEYVAAFNAGTVSGGQTEYKAEQEFKFMTESTVDEGEESDYTEGELTPADLERIRALMATRPQSCDDTEVEDIGEIPGTVPNVADHITLVNNDVIPADETDFSSWSREQLIVRLHTWKASYREERARCNAKSELITGKDLAIYRLESNKRKLETSEGNAIKENKRLKKGLDKGKLERTALKETVSAQLEQIDKLSDRRLLLRNRLIALRKEANDMQSRFNDQVALNRHLHEMIPDPDEPESEPETEEPTDIEPSSPDHGAMEDAADEYHPGDAI